MPTRAVPPATAQMATHQFPRHRRSVRRARAALREQLAIWHVAGELIDRATLLLSELTANAVNAKTTPGREVRVRFVLSGRELRVEVADASDEQPVRRRASDDDESGRGLALVAALADAWGVEQRKVVGKVVWALILLVPPEGDA
ncbi:ATP-binding protein [Streptomyces sp. NPDC057623]|uniref:ATP-binding protein n=1 Tax=Streptomyces sp. NPDC057623 TaxID=3346187 RepID=UPI0036A28D20